MTRMCMNAECHKQADTRVLTHGSHYLYLCEWHASTHDVTKTIRARREQLEKRVRGSKRQGVKVSIDEGAIEE